jgi:hypothetical protein
LALRLSAMEIVVDRRPVVGRPRRFEFVEREPEQYVGVESGLEEFLRDSSLSEHVTEEIEFLDSLKFRGKRRPTPIY